MVALKKNFYFDVELQEAFKSPDGKMHVVAVASDDLEDRTGDRMSSKAIEAMARQATENRLPLLDNHRSTWGFGYTHSAAARKKDSTTQFVVDFELDERYPQAHTLFESVQSGTVKEQLSIGGFLNLKNPQAVRFEENKQKKMVRVIDDIHLEHIAGTRPNMAAVPRTKFVSAVVKDIFDDESDLPEEWHESAGLKIAEAISSGLDNGTVTLTTNGEVSNVDYRTLRKESADGREIVVVLIDKDTIQGELEKSAVAFKKYSLVKTSSWNFAAKESNAVLGGDDWGRFKAAHAWVDTTNGSTPEAKSAYKLPHHWLRNGSLVTVDRGVIAAMGALLGARGGTNIPASQKRSVYNHLARHYREELGMAAPAFKDHTAEEFVTHHLEQGVALAKDWASANEEQDMTDPTKATEALELKTETAPEAEAKTETPPETEPTDKACGSKKKKSEDMDEDEEKSEKSEKSNESDEPADSEVSKGMDVIRKLGQLFKEDEPEEPVVHENVTALAKAFELLDGLELNEKSHDEVRRIYDGICRLLELEAKEEQLPTDSSLEVKSITPEIIEKIAEAVISRLPAPEQAPESDPIIKAFETNFGQLTEELAKGLVDMGSGFSTLVQKQVQGLTEKMDATEARLAKLEKAAGVRQSVPAADPVVVKGQEPQEQTTPEASTAEEVNKSRKPDTANPFRGTFDRVRAQYMAQQQRR